MMDRGRLTLVAALVVSATLAVYGATLGYGFRYDDYFLFRPWSMVELAGVWTGSWDPTGISVPFYRPLTAWWYAAMFGLFGVNTWAIHAVSLALHATCALLVFRFLRGERVPVAVSAFGAALYGVHPVLVYAQTAWLTNQMHALASVAVLCGLLTWQRVRTRSAAAWLALLPVALVAFLIKEDTIMLLPAIVVLTALKRLMMERDAGPPLWQLGAAGVMAVGAFAGSRYLLLGALGGYGVPDPAGAWELYQRGLRSALRMVPWRRPWQTLAGTIATAGLVLLPVLAVFWKRASRGVFVATAGLALVLLFNAPFALVSKAEQYHLLALGSVVLLSGVVDGLASVLAWRWWAAVVAVACAVTLFSFGAVARHIAGDFRPCHAYVLETDQLSKWWVVPVEIQQWFDTKAQACKSGATPRVTDLPRISWGVYDPEVDEQGTGFQWTSARAVLFLRESAKPFTVTLRDPGAGPAAPNRVTLASGGNRTDVTLTTSNWTSVTVPVSGRWSWLRGASEVRLSVERSFVPHEQDPSSPDKRRLGVRIRF